MLNFIKGERCLLRLVRWSPKLQCLTALTFWIDERQGYQNSAEICSYAGLFRNLHTQYTVKMKRCRSGRSLGKAPSVSNDGKSFFEEDQNCWRVAKAEKLALIVDAADYFQMLRKVISTSKRELLLIGWDFDFEMEMLPGESDSDGLAPDGLPNKLGVFLEAVVDRAPDLHLYLLKWNGAVLVAPGRLIPSLALSVFGSERIHFALDGHHPFGACHHQKIVVADDTVAFCGGIDATEGRWDTSDHLPNDPRRVDKDGAPTAPWHDATFALAGPAANALAELSRRRWHRATGEKLTAPQEPARTLWPAGLKADAEWIDIAIARTEPPYEGEPLVNEIEQLFLDSINAATDTIYIESQYFAGESIGDALEARLAEQDGPDVVVINPQFALSQFEDEAMHVLRGRMINRLKAADHQDRFRIFHPVNAAGDPIYVHAKIMIVDSRIFHLGSSNLNNRSMGFDTECDIAISAPDALITSFRTRLLSEHLDVSPDVFEETLKSEKSLIATINKLNSGAGRALCQIHPLDENLRGSILADTRLMDPRYDPGEESSSGQGFRPRHLTILTGATALGYLGWRVWKKWYRPKL